MTKPLIGTACPAQVTEKEVSVIAETIKVILLEADPALMEVYFSSLTIYNSQL